MRVADGDDQLAWPLDTSPLEREGEPPMLDVRVHGAWVLMQPLDATGPAALYRHPEPAPVRTFGLGGVAVWLPVPELWTLIRGG